MTRHGTRGLWPILAWLALMVPSMTGAAAEPVPRSMLILDESAGAAAGPFYAAVVSSLRSHVNRDPSHQASVFVEHLDLSRFRSPTYETILNAYLRSKYADKRIGVIVAIGPGALQYTLHSRSELWPNVPVVFTFVDPSIASELKLPSDVTGSTFRSKFSDMVDAARAVVPDLSGIVIVGDSLESVVAYRHFKDEVPLVAGAGLRVTDLSGLPIRELRTRLGNLDPQTAIIYTVMYSDGEGIYLAPVEALRRFADAANRPIIVNVATQVGEGGTGGFVVDPTALGGAAGSLVLRIFSGENASTIPVAQSTSVKPIFDWRQLQRWGVTDAQLPPGSEIRFRQRTAWDQYRWQIVAILFAVLLQAALIHWLLYERRMRHRSEAVARNTMSELAHMNRIATGSELSASIAHEVMQPLTGIVARANAGLRWLAAATPDVDRARAMLTEIVTAGHRTADIVRAIRATFKKDVQNRQPAQLNSLVMEIIPLVSRDLDDHEIILETDLEQGLPAVVGDRTQLQQVLLNLIVNAVDAMKAVPLRPRTLHIRSETCNPGVRVSIEDSGSGVAADALEDIFKPLFTTKKGGMGLGLSICRSIIEAHHGRIWALRREPHGLTVQFELPLDGAAGG